MIAEVRRTYPEANITGFTVAPMVRRPGAFELIVGVSDDLQFGPVIVFGQGGTAVEVIDDKALGLPPLNLHLARDIMSRTHIFRLLRGYRGLPPANLDAIALTLIRVSQLVIDHPQIVELDINPLLADEYGVIALDARVRVRPTTRAPGERLAIRPYPSELEETVHLADGRDILLRPILPEDEPALKAMFEKLSPEEVRLRFFLPMKTLSHVMAARFTQIDYDREMALVLTNRGVPGQVDIFGVVRISADPDNETAEYAIVIVGELTGMGLGVMLMRRIIGYAEERGIGEIYGDVLRENKTMLRLCEALGFVRSNPPEEPTIVRVTLKL
jgi:acetyltransferase